MNTDRPDAIAAKITKDLGPSAVIGILGLSFKPESDDVRDTPAYKIIRALQNKGFTHILAYDPVAVEEFKKHYPDVDVKYFDSTEAVYRAADVIAVVTAWDEFRKVPQLGDKPVVDCRYMFGTVMK
jgi:UDPglucose 6-dehydrogenase